MYLTSVIIDAYEATYLYQFPGKSVPLLSWIKDSAKKDNIGLSDSQWEELYANGRTNDSVTLMTIKTNDVLVTGLSDEEMSRVLVNHLNAYPLRDGRLEAMCQAVHSAAEQKLMADFCFAFMIHMAFLESHKVDARNAPAAHLGNQILLFLMEGRLSYSPTHELRQMIDTRKAVVFGQT